MERLISLISDTLQGGGEMARCVVFREHLERVFPLAKEGFERAKAIRAFAEQNGWNVDIQTIQTATFTHKRTDAAEPPEVLKVVHV